MYVIVVVWIVVVLIGILLFARFTRPPTAPRIGVPGERAAAPRRVYPLWLVLVLLILLVTALWFTLHYGTQHLGAGRSAATPGVTAGPPRG